VGHAGGGYTDDGGTSSPVEAVGTVPGMQEGRKGYFGGRDYQAAPQEMETPTVVHEIGEGR